MAYKFSRVNTDKKKQYLCNNKHIRTADNVFRDFIANCFAHFLFIIVQKCSVKVSITNINCLFNCRNSLATFYLIIKMNRLHYYYNIFFRNFGNEIETKYFRFKIVIS